METSDQRSDILDKVKRLVIDQLKGNNVKVYLFGSWVRNEEATSSDIDIGISSQDLLPQGMLAKLREALEESSIPYNVDIVDLAHVEDDFYRKVVEEGIEWNV